jgi:hypothetical protein
MRKKRVLLFASIWILLCLTIPQIRTSPERSLFPFVNWRLFSVQGRNWFSIIKTRCGNEIYHPAVAVLDEPDLVPHDQRSKYVFRLLAIGRLFETGEHEEAIRNLHKFGEMFLKRSRTCSFELFTGDVTADLKFVNPHVIEGTDFDM